MKFWFIIFAAVVLKQAVRAEDKYFSATNLWQADVGYNNQSSPALDTNGAIYVTSWDGRLLAFNPDGTRRWIFKIGFESVSSPAIGSDGTIFFGARNRRVYAVAATGRQKWDFKTGGWVDASPAIGSDGTVYLGSWDKKFYALDATGKLKWSFATGGPIVSSAAIDATGVIYFGSQDRKLYALNPDGTKRWEFMTRGAITSSPAIGSAGEIYFASVDGKLYAVNSDGSKRWELQTGGFTPSSPVIGATGEIYLSVNKTHCAISPAGKLLWQRDFWNAQPDDYGETAGAVLADGSVVFTGGDGFVMTVPKEDGAREFIWNYWLYGWSFSAPLVSPDGTIQVMSIAGKLTSLQRHIPLARTPWPMFRGNPQRTGRAAAGP